VVVVVPPPSSVVLVVLLDPHGQSSVTGCPTEKLRHMSASVAATGRLPLGAQMHSGLQAARPTEAWRM
jgi:hypothetical protein